MMRFFGRNVMTDEGRGGKPIGLNIARWLALGAIAGPVIFIFAMFVLGSFRPGYSFVSQPVSALGIGPNGIFMNAAFVLNGLLMIGGVIAVFQNAKLELGTAARWICAGLLLLSPIGVLLCGIFTMNTLSLHMVGVQLAFTTPIFSFLIAGLLLRRAPSWRRFGTWMLLGCPLTIALLVGFITSVPFAQMATGGGAMGLWQRAMGVEVLAWYAAMGWLGFRRCTLFR
jgi:hypothetical membrane protein